MSISYRELIESMGMKSPCCGSEIIINYKSVTNKTTHFCEHTEISPVLVCANCNREYNPESPIINVHLEFKYKL